ncbi:hypothetical protein ACS0TY_023265 [Phlomoides rotata]
MDWAVATEILEKETASTASATPICSNLRLDSIFKEGLREGSAISEAIERSNCFHLKGDNSPCRVSSNPYMIAFGAIEIVFSQIPNFDQISWLSIVAAVMSFTYSNIQSV